MIVSGKYDTICTMVREGIRADAVVLAVCNGIHGSGFSVQAPPHVVKQLPSLLRQIADQIESQKGMGGKLNEQLPNRIIVLGQ